MTVAVFPIQRFAMCRRCTPCRDGFNESKNTEVFPVQMLPRPESLSPSNPGAIVCFANVRCVLRSH
jgi:hypothetical protein